jgi:hypothetical protein
MQAGIPDERGSRVEPSLSSRTTTPAVDICTTDPYIFDACPATLISAHPALDAIDGRLSSEVLQVPGMR